MPFESVDFSDFDNQVLRPSPTPEVLLDVDVQDVGISANAWRRYLVESRARFEQRFTQLEERIDQRLTSIEQRLDILIPLAVQSQTLVRKNENHLHRGENDYSLVEVPFANGLLPWGKTVKVPTQDSVSTVKLPALTSVDAVNLLDSPQTHAYFQGYYPDVNLPSIPICKEQILLAIGRSLEDQ